MNWFGRLLGFGKTQERSGSIENPSVPLSAATIEDFSTGSVSADGGPSISPYRALGYSPLYQAVSMISGDCAKMPLNIYRKTDNGRELFKDHPAQSKIHLSGSANEELNAYKFWRRFFTSALMHNNAYAYIDRSNSGQVLGLYNLLPDRTKPARYKGKLYFLTEVGGEMEALDANDVLHVEGLTLDNLCGADIIKLFREDFQIALGRRNFTSKFFRNNMTAGGILTVPPNAKPEAVRKITGKMAEKFKPDGESAFKTLVLRDGYKWFSTQVNPENAQLSEMDADQARAVARMYNLHPSRLGVPGSQSYNTLEMAKADYYDGALSHWLISNKSEGNKKLLSDQERLAGIYVDYNINALLWADAATRSQIAIAGIQHGRFSPQETREWENMNGYEGGDTFYRPLNLQPIGEPPINEKPTEKKSSQAMRKLLADAFQRASNRVGIRGAKKGYDLEEDRQTLVEIIEPSIAVALESVGEIGTEARTVANDWVKSWSENLSMRDIEVVKRDAVIQSEKVIENLLGDK